MQDGRDPEALGLALRALRRSNPKQPLHELADMLPAFAIDGAQPVQTDALSRLFKLSFNPNGH